MKRPPTLLALVLGLALAAGAVAPAAADRDRGRARDSAQQERRISLDEAVAQAERRYKARAIRAEEKRNGDRIEYRIRLLGEDGRVFEVRIDAGSGRED
jgi:uncharacterized membrane protein YkoI